MPIRFLISVAEATNPVAKLNESSLAERFDATNRVTKQDHKLMDKITALLSSIRTVTPTPDSPRSSVAGNQNNNSVRQASESKNPEVVPDKPPEFLSKRSGAINLRIKVHAIRSRPLFDNLEEGSHPIK